MHPISSNRKRNIFHIFIIIIFQMRNIFLTIVLFCFVVCCIILNSVVAIWTSIPIYIFPSHYWNYTRNLIINWNVVFVAQLAQPTASQRPGAQNKFHRKPWVMLLYSRAWNDGYPKVIIIRNERLSDTMLTNPPVPYGLCVSVPISRLLTVST